MFEQGAGVGPRFGVRAARGRNNFPRRTGVGTPLTIPPGRQTDTEDRSPLGWPGSDLDRAAVGALPLP